MGTRMIRLARIYTAILLALSVLLALYYFATTGSSLALRAGMVVYCVALALILLGLYGRGGRDLTRIALALSVLWALWGLVELGIWYVARPGGFSAVTAFVGAILFSVVPGVLSALALRQLQRGAGAAAPAQPAVRT